MNSTVFAYLLLIYFVVVQKESVKWYPAGTLKLQYTVIRFWDDADFISITNIRCLP